MLHLKSEIRISKSERLQRRKGNYDLSALGKSESERSGRNPKGLREKNGNYAVIGRAANYLHVRNWLQKRKLETEKKKYDLEERTEKFSLKVRDFCGRLKRDVINIEYVRQLIKGAGSVPANYIEANESLGNQDKKMHIKICRKEAKESRLWLRHVLTYGDQHLEVVRLELLQEAFELENIFGAIYRKLENKKGSQAN